MLSKDEVTWRNVQNMNGHVVPQNSTYYTKKYTHTSCTGTLKLQCTTHGPGKRPFPSGGTRLRTWLRAISPHNIQVILSSTISWYYSPGWPSPTDSDVKRNVSSNSSGSMCPFCWNPLIYGIEVSGILNLGPNSATTSTATMEKRPPSTLALLFITSALSRDSPAWRVPSVALKIEQAHLHSNSTLLLYPAHCSLHYLSICILFNIITESLHYLLP
jgi:hypothetical protein